MKNQTEWKEVKGKRYWYVCGTRFSLKDQGLTLTSEGTLVFGRPVTIFDTWSKANSAMKRTMKEREDWRLEIIPARVESHRVPK